MNYRLLFAGLCVCPLAGCEQNYGIARMASSQDAADADGVADSIPAPENPRVVSDPDLVVEWKGPVRYSWDGEVSADGRFVGFGAYEQVGAQRYGMRAFAKNLQSGRLYSLGVADDSESSSDRIRSHLEGTTAIGGSGQLRVAPSADGRFWIHTYNNKRVYLTELTKGRGQNIFESGNNEKAEGRCISPSGRFVGVWVRSQSSPPLHVVIDAQTRDRRNVGGTSAFQISKCTVSDDGSLYYQDRTTLFKSSPGQAPVALSSQGSLGRFFGVSSDGRFLSYLELPSGCSGSNMTECGKSYRQDTLTGTLTDLRYRVGNALALSDDGRWMSFLTRYREGATNPNDSSLALEDLETGAIRLVLPDQGGAYSSTNFVSLSANGGIVAVTLSVRDLYQKLQQLSLPMPKIRFPGDPQAQIVLYKKMGSGQLGIASTAE